MTPRKKAELETTPGPGLKISGPAGGLKRSNRKDRFVELSSWFEDVVPAFKGRARLRKGDLNSIILEYDISDTPRDDASLLPWEAARALEIPLGMNLVQARVEVVKALATAHL